MKKVIEGLEILIKLLSITLGIFTLLETINAWIYRRRLAKKAEEYLEDEWIPDNYLGDTIKVYSPKVIDNQKRIKMLLISLGASCSMLTVIRLFKSK